MCVYQDIKTKPIIVVGQGPSAQCLKENIEMFRGHDVLWASLNRFHVAEKEILSAIDVDFDIIWFSALLRYEEMHEQIKQAGKRGSLIMTKAVIAEYFDFPANIYASDFGTGFSSLFALLCALIKLGARNIYLIGFDGHASGPADVYYGQDKMRSDNYESRMRSIARDTKMMNIFFWEYVEYALNQSRSEVSITNLAGSLIQCFPCMQIGEMADKSSGGLIKPILEKKPPAYKILKRVKMRALQLFVSPQYGNVSTGQIINVTERQASVFINNRLAERCDSPVPIVIKKKRKKRKRDIVETKKIESYYTMDHAELLTRLKKIFKIGERR